MRGRSMLAMLAGGFAFALSLSWAVPSHASPWTVQTAVGPAEPGGTGEDEERAEAEAEWQQGSNDYALGKYEDAVAHFERSYELSQEPAILDNLGQSYRRWYDISEDPEHLRKAKKLWENFLLYLDAGSGLAAQELADAKTETQERIDEAQAALDEHKRQHAVGTGRDGKGGEKGTDGKGTDKRPLYKKGWFWGVIVGTVVVAAGVTTAVVLTTRSRDDGFDPELGTLGRAPLGPALIRF